MDSLPSTRQTVGIQIVPAGLLFKVLLDICYIHHVSPSYSYMGMILSLDYHKLVESYLMALGLLLVSSWRSRTPSAIILLIGLFTGIIPLTSIYALQDRSASFIYATLLTFGIAMVITWMPRLRLSYLTIGREIFISICALFVAAIVYYLIAQGAYRHFTLELYSIYGYRRELGDLVFVGPFKYFAHWAHGVFTIALLVWAMHHKNKMLAAAVVSAQIFIYGSTLLKALLFNFLFIIGLYYILKPKGNIGLLLWLLCAAVGAGMLETVFLGEKYLTDLITRRVVFLPPYLANEYYELFREIGHVYWTSGFFGGFAPYPFPYDPANLVGQSAMGSRETWANNGMFGMGFMQAGFAGMLLYGVVYGLWLYIIDCISIGRVPVEVAVCMVIVPTLLVVTDTDLPTTLVTHGGIVATLMLWLWAGIARERRPGYEIGRGVPAPTGRHAEQVR
jgi:hypothetical protein